MATKNPKQRPYGNAYKNSASPANSVPGDRAGKNGNALTPQIEAARRRNIKLEANRRNSPDDVEHGRGDGPINKTLKRKRKSK